MFRRSIGETFETARDSISRAAHFLSCGLWRVRVKREPFLKAFGIRILRALVHSGRGYHSDRCQLRASALTYYTLMSIVPMLAMAFGVAKGFGLEEWLQQKLTNIEGQKVVMTQLITFAKTMLSTTSGGLVAGVGVIVLVWSVISMLGSIEHSFNAIWGVKRDRHIGRKFTDYFSFVILGLLLFIAFSSAMVMVNERVQSVVASVETLHAVAPVISALLQCSSFVLIWLLCSFIYLFMPNTKVKYLPGIAAGVITGTLLRLLFWGYITSQIGVASYGKVYGSFAALPLFLVLVQFMWMVLLYGAELAFAFQNVDTYEFEQDCIEASPAFKRLLTLRILQAIVHRFAAGEPPMDSAGIAAQLDIPIRLVRQLTFDLVECGLLNIVQDEEHKPRRYQPARDIHALTIACVMTALDHHGKEDIPVAESVELDRLRKAISAIGSSLATSPGNKLLKDV